MWKTVAVSVEGLSHIAREIPCQDHCVAKEVNGAVALVIADGAGSAAYAEEASRETVEFLLNKVLDALEGSSAENPRNFLSSFTKEDGEAWYSECRLRLEYCANERRADLGDFLSTALVAMLDREGCIFMQVGDGCWIVEQADAEPQAITWPSAGEFVGQTHFLASEGWRNAFQFEKLTGSIRSVAGISDGLEMLALDFKNKMASPSFFLPFIQRLNTEEDCDGFAIKLADYLRSDRVCERTDDDKTLVLATRDEVGI